MIPLCVYGVVLCTAAAAPADPLSANRISQMDAAVRPQWQAYWDASQIARARDQQVITDELKRMGENAQWQPPPGRLLRPPGFGMDDDWYASAEARTAADNVLTFQTPAGGWSKGIDPYSAARKPGMGFSTSRGHYQGTFDNSATTSQLRFLGRIALAQDHAPARAGFIRGLRYILAAQYPNGGWPQVYPLEGGYHDNVTFNDSAMIHVMQLLHDVAEGQFPLVDESQREECRAALQRGVDFILASQIVQHGEKSVWCAQHDPLTQQPTGARSYEWASLSGGESAEIVLYLMNRASQTPAVRDAVEAAHEWFQRNAIYGKRYDSRGLQLIDQEGAGPIWARFYELETGRPMFVARNAKQAVYEVNQLPPESNGYAWYVSSGAAVLKQYPKWKHATAAAERTRLYLVGDSLMQTGRSDGSTGPWGWGSELGHHFDSDRVEVINRARGGRSSRSFLREGLWEEVLAQLRPQDFVIVGFGHNDIIGSRDHPNRATISGNGDQTLTLGIGSEAETVHTYGWCLRKYASDVRAKGATILFCTPVPRNTWEQGRILRGFDGYAAWATEAAKEADVPLLDLNVHVAGALDAIGQSAAKEYYNDTQHTNRRGAQLVADIAAQRIRSLADVPNVRILRQSLKNK